MTIALGSQPVAEIAVNDLKEEQLQKLNPKVVAAIQAIQGERMGKAPIGGGGFRSHITN